MKYLRLSIVFIAVWFVVFACTRDDPKETFSYLHGVLVTNEGNFMDNNGSVSFMPVSEDTVMNDVFAEVNNRPLGDVVMSFAAWQGKGYIVANNSGKVEIVDLKTFQSAGVIEVAYPRHIVIAGDGKGYITFGSFPGKVRVFDAATAEVITDVAVGNQPERMIVDGNNLLVANGQWGNDTTVSVIDRTTNEVIKTVPAGDGPVAFVRDGSGSIWVLCQGKVVYSNDWSYIEFESDARLVSLLPGSYTPSKSYIVGKTGDYFNPSSIATDPSGQYIYFVEQEGVYAFQPSSSQMPENPLIHGSFSSVTVNPLNGRLYVTEIKGYTASGNLHIFTPDALKIRSFQVGIAPNGAYVY